MLSFPVLFILLIGLAKTFFTLSECKGAQNYDQFLLVRFYCTFKDRSKFPHENAKTNSRLIAPFFFFGFVL